MSIKGLRKNPPTVIVTVFPLVLHLQPTTTPCILALFHPIIIQTKEGLPVEVVITPTGILARNPLVKTMAFAGLTMVVRQAIDVFAILSTKV